MSLIRLIAGSADGFFQEGTKEKRADRAVRDDGQIAFRMAGYDPIHGLPNPRLCIERAFPTSNASLWLGEEGVGDGFELRRRKKAGGASIVLT